MALRRRKRHCEQGLWIATNELESAPRSRFYDALNRLLAEGDFDRVVEDACAPHYQPEHTPGRPSIPPGVFFRMLLVGYFEGIESERGICWRCSDSLSLRSFLGLSLTDRTPDHSSLSRIRWRLPASVFAGVFDLVLKIVADNGLLSGRVVGIDSTYLRADASMKAIVRRDTEEGYFEYVERLAAHDAGREVNAEEVRAFDRKRKKRTSNREWRSATDPDARITRIKDGRTRLAYKAEHVVDLETGALLGARIVPADAADTLTLVASVADANERLARSKGIALDGVAVEREAEPASLTAVEASRAVVTIVAEDEDASVDAADAVAASVISEVVDEAIGSNCDAVADAAARETVTSESAPSEAQHAERDPACGAPALQRAVTSLRIVADKGYHKSISIRELKEAGFRTVIPERAIRGKRSWADKGGRLTALAVYQNKWRTQRAAGKRWLRKRGELVERSFATTCDTGAARRTRLRGLANVQKRYSITTAAANLGIVMRARLGHGTPRGLHDRDRGDPSPRSATVGPTNRPTGRLQPLTIRRRINARLTPRVPPRQQHHPTDPARAHSSTGC